MSAENVLWGAPRIQGELLKPAPPRIVGEPDAPDYYIAHADEVIE
jgi:hypothetical protein